MSNITEHFTIKSIIAILSSVVIMTALYTLQMHTSSFAKDNVSVVEIDKTSDVNDSVHKYKYPTIFATDIYVNYQSVFNPLNGVSAIDNDTGLSLTNNITANGNVDTSKRGLYQVHYSVTSKNGVTGNKYIQVIVR